jgi:hypothetical protein
LLPIDLREFRSDASFVNFSRSPVEDKYELLARPDFHWATVYERGDEPALFQVTYSMLDAGCWKFEVRQTSGSFHGMWPLIWISLVEHPDSRVAD